jgi:hypothetical protein
MPTTFGKPNQFNTGNHYNAEGQPITWAEFVNGDVKGIIYTDHARGITQLIPMPGEIGHTRYCGDIKPFICDAPIGNGYVREFERNSAAIGDGKWNEDVHRIYREVEQDFRVVVKMTYCDRVILGGK